MSEQNAQQPQATEETIQTQDSNQEAGPGEANSSLPEKPPPGGNEGVEGAEGEIGTGNGERDGSKVEADGNSELTLRALVTTKEAGVIIGKGGHNVADLRDSTGVKAGVSKVVPGVQDRVLTVTGTLDGVAKAYSLIAQTMLDNPITPQTLGSAHVQQSTIASIRLLVSHNLMGTIIGRQGLKIKSIQDVSGARMVATKEMLPQSTERVVEVQGMVDSVRVAIWEIGKCLIEDAERGTGTVHYNPTARLTTGVGAVGPSTMFAERSPVLPRVIRTGHGADFARPVYETAHYDPDRDPYIQANTRTQEISIPADYVGCIIGKGGARISEIRRLSGSRISIAKASTEEGSERMFTISGTLEANEKALYLLYHQLEMEKQRRLRPGGTVIPENEQ